MKIKSVTIREVNVNKERGYDRFDGLELEVSV